MILLKHELEDILKTTISDLSCYTKVEAMYQTSCSDGTEKTYQIGVKTLETYKFYTQDPVLIPLEFRIDQESHWWNMCEYVITRGNIEKFKEWKFCYERKQ